MRIGITKPLFAWECLEDSPSLKTLKELLTAIPDQRLLESLRRARGKGRGDYPVHVLWGVVVLSIACLQRLGLVVPDLGKDTAGDATALNARRKPDEAKAVQEEATGLPPCRAARRNSSGCTKAAPRWSG